MGVKGRLYTTGDIADRLGVGRQRAYVLSRQRDFPEPWDEWPGDLAVWRVEDMDPWIEAYLAKRRQPTEGE